jgi:membrane dipeptidase
VDPLGARSDHRRVDRVDGRRVPPGAQAGRHGAFISIQGANALSADDAAIDLAISGGVSRVTLVHLTNSRLGASSSPLSKFGRDRGLTDFGRSMVEQLDASRVIVDLAHISRPGFWDAVTHTTRRCR